MGNELRTRARRVLLQQIAPVYHDASGPQKQQILEEFVSATGNARKYALWLLHHAEEVFTPTSALRRYGPEVEEVLVLIWKTLNRICTKRLIPFLPDILEPLEKDGHVQLSQEHRSLLLSMSAATADRLLQAHRYTHHHGLSTTKAGPLLKQQIPIRTFAQWDEAKPGFLEVGDLTRFWMVEEEKFKRESKIPFYIYIHTDRSIATNNQLWRYLYYKEGNASFRATRRVERVILMKKAH